MRIGPAVKTFIVWLAFCTGAIADLTRSTPVQSPNDPASYRVITLENGFRALLVSDPETSPAAFSLDVAAGNGDNPPDWEGMAHYLEHLLVVGPGGRDRFGDWLAGRGGYRNGYTTFENTNYQVVVDPEGLAGALKRFGKIIRKPRFSAERVGEELSMVEAEFLLGLKHEGRRTLEVLQSVANPDHPYSRFASGNAASLGQRSQDEATEAMEVFHDRYYTASRLRLAVVAPQTLDVLERWVAGAFEDLQAGPPPSTIQAPFLRPQDLPLEVLMRPAAGLRQLQLLFPIPDPRTEYASKPATYLAQLLGDEGRGSALEALKADGLATGLTAGTTMTWPGGGLFGIAVELTPAGVTESDAVLRCLFGYLERLRSVGPERSRFDEMARLASLRFRYAELPEPRSRAAALAANLQAYAADDVLTGPWLMSTWNPSAIDATLARLVPDNSLVMLIAPGLTTDRRTTHYDAPFSARQVPQDRVLSWRTADPDPRLSLPAPNPYLPDDLALVAPTDGAVATPESIHRSPSFTSWFAPDASYGQPRAAIDLHVRGDQPIDTAGREARILLHAALLEDHLAAPAYPARLAGLQHGVAMIEDGLALRIRGLSPKLPAFGERIWGQILAFDPDPASFERVRESLAASLERRIEGSTSSARVIGKLDTTLLDYRHPPEEVAAALRSLTRESQAEHQARFWKGASARLLASGNLERATFLQLAERFQATLDPAAKPRPSPDVRKLPAGEPQRIFVREPGDSAVAWYLQAPREGWDQRAFHALVAELLGPRLFRDLRDRRQLAYLTEAVAWPRHGLPGVMALMQAPGIDAAAADAALSEVISSLGDSVTQGEFMQRKANLVRRLRTPHHSQASHADALWDDLLAGNETFDTRERLADALDRVSWQGWREDFRLQVDRSPRSLVVVTGPGADAPGGPGSAETGAGRPPQ